MKLNKLTKGLTAGLLAGIMVLGTACSGSSDTPSNSSAPVQTKTADASESGGSTAETLSIADFVDNKITITAMSQGPSGSNNPITNYADNEFFKELAKRTGVSIDFTHPIYGNESTEFDLMLSSGEYTDLLWALRIEYKGGDDAAIDDGVFRDLTPYVEKYMPNYWNVLQINDEARRAAYTEKGRISNIVRVEYNMEKGQVEAQPAFAGIMIRQDWLDELNLKTPVTYEDWTNVLTAFKEKKNCSQPLYMPATGFWGLTQFASGYGALNMMQVNDGVINYGPATDGWKNFVTLLHGWYENGLIGSEYVANDALGMDLAAIMNEDSGAMFAVYTVAPVMEQGIQGGGKLAALQLPVVKAGEVAQGGANDGKTVSKNIYVTTHVSDADLPQVLTMLDYLYTVEGSHLATYGLEGDTCTVNENGIYEFTDKILNNSNGYTPAISMDTFCCPSTLQLLQGWNREYIAITDSQFEMCKTWDKDGHDLIVPDITLNAEENEAYSKAMTDVETHMAEMTNKFIMGTASIDDEWDNYVNDLKSMGLEKAIAAYQSAYDRYMSK